LTSYVCRRVDTSCCMLRERPAGSFGRSPSKGRASRFPRPCRRQHAGVSAAGYRDGHGIYA
jgi:hypothetical protein